MLILTCIQGPDKGRRFELPANEPQLIGRSSEALPLHDATISRRHAELTPDSGRWFINDLQSSNGTFVNGHRVNKRALLHIGDQIRTGTTILLFGHEGMSNRLPQIRMAGDEPEIPAQVEKSVTSSDDSLMLAISDPSAAASIQLRLIYNVTALIGTVDTREELLDKIMEMIFDFFQADRGFILLQENPDDKPNPAVIRHRQTPKNKRDAQITVSKTIIQLVLGKSEGVLSSNAMTDKRFASGDSVQNYKIRSAMCVPIKFKAKTFGVIHLDSMMINFTFTEDQLKLLTAIGVQTGLALSNEALYKERLERERLAAVGQTVASLSHSIKNILQGMRGGADLVEMGFKKENTALVKGGWDIVSRNLERIYGLSMNMLAYSKQRKPEIEMVNFSKLIKELGELIEHRFDHRKVALVFDIDPDIPPVPMDSSGIHQALLNLLVNALDACEPDKGVVTVKAMYTADPQILTIQVIDNGGGIPKEIQPHLFEPFYSTKGLGGTGLGLVVTQKVIDEHKGEIEFESSEEGGTTFTITLPCSTDIERESADTIAPSK